MSEMAGIEAMLTAAELLSVNAGGNGVLLGGISGVPSAKVVIFPTRGFPSPATSAT
jgi:alanine dehydrogenase